MRTHFKALSVAGLACFSGIASAADAPAALVGLSKAFVDSGITVAGYADASYTTFLQKTNADTLPGASNFHAFDTNNSTFAVNQAALTVSYLPTEGFGGLVNVITGDDASVVNGAFGYGSGGKDFALTQAFVQYAVGGLTVIGGRFVTLAGAEVIDDSKNTNVSRSLLFTNAEPLVHTGLRASYKLSDMFSTTVGVNNTAAGPGSTGVVGDKDKHKTLEVGATFTPTSSISVALADYYGLDGTGSSTYKNNFLDLVASWQATDSLQFVLNGDYVRSIHSGAGYTTTTGVAAYVNYTISDQWKASLRAETMSIESKNSFAGGEGVSPSNTIHISEVTATVDYSATKNFDLLAEGRIDYGSNGVTGVGYENIFVGGGNGGGRKSQPELLLKAIFKFGTPTGS